MSRPARVAVLVVGGGPAGLATALALAHAAPELAERILVLEKEHYPRDKYCAGALGGRADRVLGSLGVRVDVPSVVVGGVVFRCAFGTRTVRIGRIGRVVRRIEFDHELSRVARDRGIRIVEGARVSSVRWGSGSVEVDSTAGSFRSAVLVGADGVGSVVRRAIGLSNTRYVAQALEVDTPGVDGDHDRDLLVFDTGFQSLPGYVWDFPTLVDGREMVCRGAYLLRDARRPGRRQDLREVLARRLESKGLRLSSFRTKRFAERGFEPPAPVSRPRTILVGEAAGIDPVTGEGIAQAVQYGAAAGRYLAGKLLVERDYGFADWEKFIAASSVGRDLWVRAFGSPLFYGPIRPNIERFVLSTPDFVTVGLQHFAGRRWSRASIARAGLGAAKYTLRWLLMRRSAERPADSEPPGDAALEHTA